jgi:hypothetical protein
MPELVSGWKEHGKGGNMILERKEFRILQVRNFVEGNGASSSEDIYCWR